MPSGKELRNDESETGENGSASPGEKARSANEDRAEADRQYCQAHITDLEQRLMQVGDPSHGILSHEFQGPANSCDFNAAKNTQDRMGYIDSITAPLSCLQVAVLMILCRYRECCSMIGCWDHKQTQ